MINATRLTTLTSCGGCVAKAGPGWLSDILSPLASMFPPSASPELLVGLDGPDDAAVYQVSDDQALIATIDFFPPLVDDPYTFGAIAATNAMSDVYAMGGEVTFALNVAAFPETLPADECGAILRGGAEKVAEAGGVIAGGHTIWADEPTYGLTVMGFAHPDRLFSKGGLRPGDAIYLTKPIGTGTIISAIRDGLASADLLRPAVESMTRLNRDAAIAAREAGVRAATDVTGFGLLGHLWEMVRRSGVTITLGASQVPWLPGALEAAAQGVATSGGGRNRAWVAGGALIAEDIPAQEAALLYDPQTSGGLVLGAQGKMAARLEHELETRGVPFARIGYASVGAPEIVVQAVVEGPTDNGSGGTNG